MAHSETPLTNVLAKKLKNRIFSCLQKINFFAQTLFPTK